ncbi:hypothetical protein C8Q77DRAFT_1154302 [Trametes polyzona]|nr:hypothetical protein C8Q77DRAFT_1154302 [Trametes polyzona]
MASQQPVIVDDQEPRIQYSSGWYIADGSDVALAYNDTLHVTLAQGATASLTFTGTSVAVYGCGGNTNQYGWPSTSFVVDGVSYETRVDKTATPDTQFFNVLMFASPTLPAGEHTIVLTNLNGTAPNTFFFDRFEYIPSNAANKTTSSAPAST